MWDIVSTIPDASRWTYVHVCTFKTQTKQHYLCSSSWNDYEKKQRLNFSFLGNLKVWKTTSIQTTLTKRVCFHATLKVDSHQWPSLFIFQTFQQDSLIVWCIRKYPKESISTFCRTEKQAELCTYLWVTDKQHSFCSSNCLCLLTESQIWSVFSWFILVHSHNSLLWLWETNLATASVSLWGEQTETLLTKD